MKVKTKTTGKQNEFALFDEPGPKAKRNIRIINIVGVFVIVGILYFVYVRFNQNGQFRGDLWENALNANAWKYYYLPGLFATLKASFFSIIGALAFGVFFGMTRLVRSLPVRLIAGVVVEFCRAVPVLMFMIFLWRFYAMFNIPEPAFYSVVTSLILYNGSIIAELIRSGVNNLPPGQREAGFALGMSRVKTLINIEVPQAFLAMLPAIVTQLVVVIKDTALGSIIMYTDILQEARRLGQVHFNILQTLIIVSVIYFIITFTLTRIAEWLPNTSISAHTEVADEVAAIAPIAIMNPSNIEEQAYVREVKSGLPKGGVGTRHAEHIEHDLHVIPLSKGDGDGLYGRRDEG
jgi:glutamate transport system permease protein